MIIDSGVQVCPERDIVCGHRPENWCEECPFRGGEVSDEMRQLSEQCGDLIYLLNAMENAAAQDMPAGSRLLR